MADVDKFIDQNSRIFYNSMNVLIEVQKIVAKFLETTIQVNLMPIHSETGMKQHKFTWIVSKLLKFLLLTYYTITAISWPPPVFHNFYPGFCIGVAY